METLYKEGLVRAIGVSNFHEHHLESLLEIADVVPAINQVELHPLLSQTNLVARLKVACSPNIFVRWVEGILIL